MANSSSNKNGIGIYILQNFKDRNMPMDEDLFAVNQRKCDNSLENYLYKLHDVPSEKWISFCDWQGMPPIYAAAATYCQDFSWNALRDTLKTEHWAITPLSDAAVAASFSCSESLPKDRPYYAISTLLQFQQEISLTIFLLAAFDLPPQLDTSLQKALALEPQVAQFVAWLWAKYGFGKEESGLLQHWATSHHDYEGLRFWSSFALILREPERHDEIPVLEELARADTVHRMAAEGLRRAMTAGPPSSDAVIRAFYELWGGDQLERLARALRLAIFVPGTAPLVDPYAPWWRQRELAVQLKKVVDQAIASGASFTPAVYAEKARRTHALKTEADKREKKLKERMEPRGWSESAVTEALASGPGIPVLGYPYGLALLRFHPVTHLPIVTCAETNEVIHIGRAGYVYDIDKDAHQAIPEAERPPLPAWHEPAPSTADLTPVYVRLKNEWIDVWRPVDGRWVERNVYCLMPHGIPEDETQEFWIGHHVECTIRRFGNGIGQAATKLAERR